MHKVANMEQPLKLVLPERILKVHAQRAALNVYLFVFAPVTLPAMEILSCTSPCDNVDTCKHERRLAFDMSCRSSVGRTTTHG